MSAGEDFWSFSMRVYGNADVPTACLALQNECDLDVNLLLYCCWLGTHGSQLDAAALAQALEFAGPWAEHVVRPLRHARTWMKHDSDARARLPPDVYAELRESIKTIELEAERLQQLALEAIADQPAGLPAGANDAASCASINLLLYASEAGITPDAALHTRLATIVSAATGVAPARAAERLAAAGQSGPRSIDG